MDMRILPLEERIVLDAAGLADIAEVFVAHDVTVDSFGEVEGFGGAEELAVEAVNGALEAISAEGVSGQNGLSESGYVSVSSFDLAVDGEISLIGADAGVSFEDVRTDSFSIDGFAANGRDFSQ